MFLYFGFYRYMLLSKVFWDSVFLYFSVARQVLPYPLLSLYHALSRSTVSLFSFLSFPLSFFPLCHFIVFSLLVDQPRMNMQTRARSKPIIFQCGSRFGGRKFHFVDTSPKHIDTFFVCARVQAHPWPGSNVVNWYAVIRFSFAVVAIYDRASNDRQSAVQVK